MFSVLIIDDELVSHEYIRSLIPWEAEGLNCRPPAYGGEDARRLMEESPADIVLLDMFMPGENGVELCRYILDKYPQTVILAVSSHDDYDYVREVLKYGAYDYILKHRLNEELLLSVLRDIVSRLNSRMEGVRIGPGNASRDLPHTDNSGIPERPSRPDSAVFGMGITLSVSQRKILGSLLEESNRTGAELFIRDILSSVKHVSGILGVIHDLAGLLEDHFTDKGISSDFSGIIDWAQEKSLPETEQKLLEMLREFSD